MPHEPAPEVSNPRGPALLIALSVVALLALGLAVVGLWGRGDQPTAAPQPAQNVTQGPPPPPSSRELLRVGTTFFSSIPSSHLAAGLFWNLVESSPNGVKASFVRQVPSTDNGAATILPGGKFQVRWQLLPSLRWSDGTPLRAEDLVMSHRLEPSAHTLEAQVTSEDTATFLWSDHWAQALEGFQPYPSKVFEPLLASGGREAALAYRLTHSTPGLGPYRVKEVRIGEHMLIEANPYFAGPPPSIRHIELHCFETARLIQLFKEGSLDLIVPNSITVEEAEELRQTPSRRRAYPPLSPLRLAPTGHFPPHCWQVSKHDRPW